MTTRTPCVNVQSCPQDMPSVPDWFSEVVVVAHYLTQFDLLDTLQTQVSLTRGRAGHYDVIDMVALLIGYAASGAPTLQAFWQRLLPVAVPFMALFGRDRMPHRATLSRFLTAVDATCLDALRQVFTHAVSHHGFPTDACGGLFDRQGQRFLIFDVDATRQTARQRPLLTDPQAPLPQRRMAAVCAPGYTGHKRGEIVRTRTTVLQAHTQQWIGTFAGAGNGDYVAELTAACQVIGTYLAAKGLAPAQALLRLDSLYGTTAPLIVVQQAGLGFVTRGHDYHILDLPPVQACLQRPCIGTVRHTETQVVREVFEVGRLHDWGGPLPERIVASRLVVTRYPVPSPATPLPFGKRVGNHVYELFLTTAPPERLTAVDVLDAYHQRGAFEQILSVEDTEQSMDRWCSHTPAGQTFWQIISQWLWNIRLELGVVSQDAPLRWTAWSPALLQDTTLPGTHADPAWVPDVAPSPPATYGPVVLAHATGGAGERFAGQVFTETTEGTLRCPGAHLLRIQSQHVLANGDVQLVYRAKRADCRACDLTAACLGRHASGRQPRRVSGVRQRQLAAIPAPQPIPTTPPVREPPPAPCALRWGDWSGQHIRRTWVDQLRRQTTTITTPADASPLAQSTAFPRVWTRAERSHRRLDWATRRARNQQRPTTARVTVELFGISRHVATYLDLPSVPPR